jgi:hypothetical protein
MTAAASSGSDEEPAPSAEPSASASGSEHDKLASLLEWASAQAGGPSLSTRTAVKASGAIVGDGCACL